MQQPSFKDFPFTEALLAKVIGSIDMASRAGMSFSASQHLHMLVQELALRGRQPTTAEQTDNVVPMPAHQDSAA